MGFMQGTWFDAENLMERPDIEVYVKPKWQYIVYFSTLLALLCLQALFIRLYLRRSGSRYKYAFVITAATVTILLCIIETYMIN
ncbi:hypothetical protein D0T53_11795 [Dysgonomonas sp. 216]|nr:hypothetical protein [Dysgonomonas sp. 216]